MAYILPPPPPSYSSFSLNGRVAIVTGTSSEIGRAIAIHLRSLGGKLVINYNSSSSSTQADRLVSELNSIANETYLPVAVAVKADVSKADDVKLLFDQAEKVFHAPVHIMVHCAVVLQPKYPSLANTMLEDWDNIFGANMKGAFLTCRESINRLARRGNIILVSSTVVGKLQPGYAAYEASIKAVEAMTQIVGKELKHLHELHGNGVSVNCITPGPVVRPMFNFYPQTGDELAINAVAKLVGSLIRAGGFLNGNVFPVNCGLN